MEETTSPPAHTCAHCADIVFPGSSEKIHVSRMGSLEDPFSNLDFREKILTRLGLSLADLRLKANAGCDFSQYLKDEIEHKMYKGADPNAIQLYIHLDCLSIFIEPLICLQDLHLPDNVFEGRDVSRCFVSTGWHRGLPYIYCTLANITGDDSHEEIKIRKSIVQDPLSDRTVTNVRDWLKRCEDEQHGYHKICSLSERAYVPTRLIKISGPPDQLQLKIVCRDDLEEHDVSRYVALSYCWGGDQTNKLTQENHGLYKKNIAWETLPKTIQDAAKTAQALGFQYIWIDSMCIVQNSKEDKKAEINQMTKVYAHATLTVVDSRGDRVTEGFLHPRTLPSGTTSIQYRTEDGQTQRLTLLFNHASNVEESVAVNTRGWTLQEYLLSRRRLIIGTWSTEWHCRKKDEIHTDGWARSTRMGPSAGIPYHVEDEGWAGPGPFGSKEAESVYSSSFINAAMFFSVNPGYPPGQVDKVLVCFSWIVIVTSYSKRSVTESEDRILALSGIAERFANLVSGRYIAGIWENMMPSCLYWYKFGRPVDRPVKYRGPSWSWISIDGQVEHIFSDNCLCEILSVEYMLENAEALYGAVRNATLHIKGPALSIEWRYTRQDRQEQEDKELQEDLSELRWFRDGSDDPQGLQLSVQLDAREQTAEWGEIVLLAYGFFNHGLGHQDSWCIALTKVDQVEVDNKPRHRFRRLGFVQFFDFSPLPHVESWPVSSYYVI
ncbi:hypothetical protein GT037_009122 [Alternaria burnsii]|uniref:Heterokaryon incompatibility domain-containing protein n=1 Tax=Alternaria burnsii TaxID=1187904 RepID=A0A8H7AVZ5_9PLEO|nr:uncharacterized protein GT037_009122 [Alternaria burnsii]KAF7672621.1 hypothetical protein GT037_009122 [Alternaria burnsii]